MNKKLKFAQKLVPLIITGEKVSTWRLWDDKDLQVGNIVEFIEFGTGRHFASAKLTKVIEKKLGELTDEDKKGHEKYNTDQDMYEAYKKYYDKPVDKETLVKLIWFALLK